MPTHRYSIGTRLGRYEIERHLARGGMAELYVARTVGLEGFEKQVVLKCVASHLPDREELVAMFLDEARLGALLDHPNIVQVHDIGHDTNDDWYFVMEYVRGYSVRRVLEATRASGQRLPLGVAIAIANGVLLGLDAAHSACDAEGRPLNVVHRDVSPPNVLVGLNGTVKLIDFGIAKANERRALTQTGVIKGKCGYMSPEQCRANNIDWRSDLFSAGALLFELVTGRRLFDDENDYVVMEQLVRGEIPRARSVRPDLPPELDAIIASALERDRDERIGTAREMYGRLYRFATDRGLHISQFDIAEFVQGLLADRDDAPSRWPESSRPETAEVGTIERRYSTRLLRTQRHSSDSAEARASREPPRARGASSYAAFEIVQGEVTTSPERAPSVAAVVNRSASIVVESQPGIVARVRSWRLAIASVLAAVAVVGLLVAVM